MNPVSPSMILRVFLVGATALVLAAPAGANVTRADRSMVAQYGWGAAATLSKRQSNDLVAQYGWGAAGAYAKLHA